MSLTSLHRHLSNGSINSPEFIGPPDVNGKIKDILEVNDGDIDEQIIELISMLISDAGSGFNSNGDKFKKVFANGNYIRLVDGANGTLTIDMLQMPKEGIRAMLEIFSFVNCNMKCNS